MAAAAAYSRWKMMKRIMSIRHPLGVFQILGRPFPTPAFSSAWREGDDPLGRMDQRHTWDRFYAAKTGRGATPAHFDWFFGYQEVAHLLHSVIGGLPAGPACVLDVGCGTSALGLGLYRDSPRQLEVCCLDFSPPALGALHQLLQQSPPPRHPLSELHCRLADATELPECFSPASFHLVLDKGTCDALLRCPQGPGRAQRLMWGCLSLLKPEGNLVQFSDEDPDARLPFLERAGEVNIAVKEVGSTSGICYYAYMVSRKT